MRRGAACRRIGRSIAELAAAVAGRARIQAGGGVRSLDDAAELADAGVARVVMGSAAVADPSLVEAVAGRVPVAVALDHRRGVVAVEGWTSASSLTLADGLVRFPSAEAFVITDIERDGELSGPDLEASRRGGGVATSPVIASGGVASLDDVRALAVGPRPRWDHHRQGALRGPLHGGRGARAIGEVTGVNVARVIPCLDVTGGRVVKGTQFVDLRDAGDAVELAARYDAEGADELVFLDITASSDRRDTTIDMVRRVADEVFIPFTVGGGSARPTTPGACCAQAPTRSPPTRRRSNAPSCSPRSPPSSERSAPCARSTPSAAIPADPQAGWTVYLHGGRTPTDLDAVEWAVRAAELGAGEILLTSMDRDGTGDGFDLELTRAVADAVGVPVIASGGVGTLDHLVDGIVDGHADAVLAASIFHYGAAQIADAKALLRSHGITVRPVVELEQGDHEYRRRTWSTAGSAGRGSRCRCCRSGRG